MNSITDHLHMHLLPLKTNCSCRIHIQSPHERMRCSPQAGHCLTPHKHSWGVHRLISLRPSLPRKPSDSSGEGSSLPRLPHFICQSQVQAVSCVSDLWIQIRRPRGAVRIWSFARVAQRAQRTVHLSRPAAHCKGSTSAVSIPWDASPCLISSALLWSSPFICSELRRQGAHRHHT